VLFACDRIEADYMGAVRRKEKYTLNFGPETSNETIFEAEAQVEQWAY
jgi:hypothetical protein